MKKLNFLYISRGPIGIKCWDELLHAFNWMNRNFSISVLEDRSSENIIINTIKNSEINVLISIQTTKIFSENVLEAVNFNAFNLHNAKLPDYKGFNTMGHAILNKEKTYTTTIHWISPGVDCGDIAYEKEFSIGEDETAYSLYHNSIYWATQNFISLLHGLDRGNIPRIPQTGEGKFYKKSDLNNYREIIDINNIDEVDVKSRAFHIPPYEPAYYILKGKKFYIKPDES